MSRNIQRISAAQTRPLRHQILRPHIPIDELIYEGDDHPLSFHVGAFVGEQHIGIATVAPETCPQQAHRSNAWRLRGMAVLPEYQGQGYGKALIQACIEHIIANQGQMLWCQGRQTASNFYQGLGFQRYGDLFELPHTGPHYIFIRELGE